MKKYKCSVCDYIYEPEKGDKEGGIKPGTPFDELPEDWTCPVCRVEKSSFVEIDDNIAPQNETRIEETVNNVNLSQYYTTYYPGQKGGDYPTDSEGKDLDTYVNFNNAEVKDLKSRAESVESSIKGYDSLLNTYIYEYLVKEQAVAFADGEGTKVEAAIEKYITSQRAKADFDAQQTWEQTWLNYMEYIQQQTNERSKDKMLSATCAIKYTNPDKSGKEWDKGGMCGYDSGK